jgi:hypothetical protein
LRPHLARADVAGELDADDSCSRCEIAEREVHPRRVDRRGSVGMARFGGDAGAVMR